MEYLPTVSDQASPACYTRHSYRPLDAQHLGPFCTRPAPRAVGRGSQANHELGDEGWEFAGKAHRVSDAAHSTKVMSSASTRQ